MVKLPKQVKIGGHNWKILYPYRFTERNDITGLCDYPMKVLMVAGHDDSGNPLPDSSIIVTVIHEILHAIDYTCGANVFTGKEPEIGAFSEIAYQIITDNLNMLIGRRSTKIWNIKI